MSETERAGLDEPKGVKLPESQDPKLIVPTQQQDQSFEARNNAYVYVMILFLSSAMMGHGYNGGLFSPQGKEYLQMYYDIYDEDEQSSIFGNINMLLGIGCALGAVFGGSMSDIIGRKRVFISVLALKVLAVMMYMIYSIPLLYVARFIDGISIGVVDGYVGSFISEITPKRFHNFSGQTPVGAIIVGMILNSNLGLAFGGEFLAEHFRLYVGWTIVPISIQLFCMLYYNIESPNYYLTRYSVRQTKDEVPNVDRAGTSKMIMGQTGTNKIETNPGGLNKIMPSPQSLPKLIPNVQGKTKISSFEKIPICETPDIDDLEPSRPAIDKKESLADLRTLTFEEKYGFSLHEKYQKIIANDIKKVYKESQVLEVLDSIFSEHQRKQIQPEVSLKDMFKKHYRYRLLIGCMLHVSLWMTGIGLVIFYGVKIFDEIDGTGQLVNSIQPWFGLLNIWFGIWIGKRVGIKSLMVYPLLGQCLFAISIGTMCYIEWYGLIVVATVGYWNSFMLGIGAVLFPYSSQILPPSGVGFLWGVHWTTSATNNKFSVLFSDAYGPGSVFMFYGIMSGIAFLVIGMLLRETKGKSLKQIEEVYEKAYCSWKS